MSSPAIFTAERRSHTIYVDSVYGSDTLTATRLGRASSPYETLAAAATAYGDAIAAGKRPLIYVRKGNYAHSTNLAKSYKTTISAATRATNVTTFTAASHTLLAHDVIRTRELGTASFNDLLKVATSSSGSFTAFNYGSNGSSSSGGFGLLPMDWYFEPGCVIRNTQTSGATWDDESGTTDVWVRVRGGATFYSDQSQIVHSASGVSSIFDIECDAMIMDKTGSTRAMIKGDTGCTSIFNIYAREEFNSRNYDILWLAGCESANVKSKRWIANGGSSADCIEDCTVGQIYIEGDYFYADVSADAYVLNMTGGAGVAASRLHIRAGTMDGQCHITNYTNTMIEAQRMNGTVTYLEDVGDPYDRACVIRGARITGNTNTAAVNNTTLGGTPKPRLQLVGCQLFKNGSATESIASTEASDIACLGCVANANKSSNVTVTGTLSVDSDLV